MIENSLNEGDLLSNSEESMDGIKILKFEYFGGVRHLAVRRVFYDESVDLWLNALGSQPEWLGEEIALRFFVLRRE